jgi:hypothetical protein
VDVYKDVTYMLDDESYSAAESHDIVRKRFVRSWETLVDGFKVCVRSRRCAFSIQLNWVHSQDSFTENNYSIFFGLAVDMLVRPWEKFIMGMRFTEVGIDWFCPPAVYSFSPSL